MTTIPKTSEMAEKVRSGASSVSPDRSGQALADAAESWFSAVTECQRELIGFVSMRLEKDGATVREVMGCKNPADVGAIQSRWVEETMRDYNSEMTKLMTICSQSVNRGAGPKK